MSRIKLSFEVFYIKEFLKKMKITWQSGIRNFLNLHIKILKIDLILLSCNKIYIFINMFLRLFSSKEPAKI